MDERDDWQYWFMNQPAISTSPSSFPSTLPDPGAFGDGSSSWPGMGDQQLGAPYGWGSSEWQALPDTQHGQQAGPSNQTPQAKRRRRSSSYDETQYQQGWEGEARSRDHHRPPAKRAATELGNCWAVPSSSALPAETMITGQAPRGLSHQGYHASQGGPELWGGEMDGTPSGSWNWKLPDPVPYRNQEGSWNPNTRPDVPTRYTSPPRLSQVDEQGSEGRIEWPHVQDQLPASPSNWNASQGRDGYGRYLTVQGQVMETPLNTPQAFGGAHQGAPIHDFGTTHTSGDSACPRFS